MLDGDLIDITRFVGAINVSHTPLGRFVTIEVARAVEIDWDGQ